MNIFDHIKRIRTVYENWGVREDMAKALEILVSKVTGLVHNSGASNLIDYPAGSTKLNGITYENTDDGIHVYGTATAASWLALDWGEKKLTAGKSYIANLGKVGIGAVYISIGYFMDEAQSAYQTIGSTENGLSFTCPSQYVSSRDMLYVPTGSTVDCVINPRLRLANSEDATQPEVYTIEEISEKIHSGSIGGGAGFKVITQASQMTDTDMIYVYNGSESGYTAGYWYYYNGTAWARGAQFYLGRDGVDGTSPTATVMSITGGARITVTDKNGTTTADVTNTSEDLTARQSISDETNRATEAETALDSRVTALENDSEETVWAQVLTKNLNGVTFRFLANVSLGLIMFDMYGTWTSAPATKSTWATLGQADVFKFDNSVWPDSWKTNIYYSKNQKGELYIMSDGTVKFGMTTDVAANSDIAPSKGGGARVKAIFPLPSVLAPISS